MEKAASQRETQGASFWINYVQNILEEEEITKREKFCKMLMTG